ncbi:unnamed protein product [Rotaria sp. Silwood2]|nr:unnamed protein product [Rotaria sp. Silwood2]CAF2576751.1 unnamed protein product [Rotaria sp. Silwood2]CAF2984947.1 unnamed protein product [Rotaria sp. Silwood2]CAF3936264.1 unnamed protein product [Rotaria sp. Silwood2]CAF4065318.1 unnamed protein product [Rotaria sp. Silwood2]
MFLKYLLLFFAIFFFTYSQSLINIAIIDGNHYPTGFLNIVIPNVTFCNHYGLILRTQWINSSYSLTDLIDHLESQKNQTNIYLSRASKLSTKLVQDFCQTYRIPFISMRSFGSITTTSFNYEYSVMPDILRVLISYLKYHHVQNAAYIYDSHEATHRIYELIKLMNNDEYFNDFSLNIRTTRYQDVYSLLYSIEIHSINKERPAKYILLDFESSLDYDRMFNKISHMGLTSDLYYYVILSTFDTCLWMKTMNFTGRLIYFDYQERDCTSDYQQSSNLNEKSSFSSKSKHHTSYYQSTISFRSDHDHYKLSNSTQLITTNSSLLSNVSNDTNIKLNSCNNKIYRNNEYFSYLYFLSQLPKTYQLYSRSLFNSLNLIISILNSNIVDCKTLRIRETETKRINANITDVNIYSIKKSSSNLFKGQIELIGKYSSIHDDYQSCHTNKRKDSSRIQIGSSSSKIYYITGVFDEPFLMLRNRTTYPTNYNEPDMDLKKLRGHVFDFHELEGFCLNLAEKVCSILNITCKFRIVQDGSFGSKNSTTGTWDGMIGEVVSRVADMAIAPLSISQKRMEVVDFSKPFMNLGISIMIRKPDAKKPGVFSFMNPVSMEIWLCFSLSYFAVSVVLFLTSRVVNSGWRRRVVRRPSYRSYSYPKSLNDRRKSEIQLQRQKQDSNESIHSSEIAVALTPPKLPTRRRHHYRIHHQIPIGLNDKIKIKEQKDEDFKKNDVHLFGISNALFFSFASFMRQSINLVPKSLSGRVAATSWWYFSLIFISSYTANLVAFLTVEKLVPPIASVEELAKQEDIKYGSVRNGTTAAFFEKANVSIFQHMWAVMQRSSSEVLVGTNDEGVAKVRKSKGKYAFFIESTKNEYVNERWPCDTMKVGSELDSKGYGIATRLGSDLSEAINMIVTNLRESGFLDNLKQRWWFERSECSQSTKDKRFSQLSLSSVTGLFYIFLFGIILSCVIAFTEFLITAKAESEQLQIDFREILRIKMIENLVGVTINAQRQLEFGRIDHECNYYYEKEEDEIIENYTQYQLHKQHSDV